MKKTGDGRRIQRVEKEVQQILAQFLSSTFTGDLPGLVTVNHVKMPADLRSARVFVSVLNGEPDSHQQAAELLQARAGEIQRFLADRLPLRYTPKLQFQADETLDRVLKIDRILHDLASRKDPSEGEDG